MVGSTLAKGSDPAIYGKEYDVVILDEASMAYVPQAAFAASLGKRVIICGDFKQLPPIASSRDLLVTKWLKEDIFHRAGVGGLGRIRKTSSTFISIKGTTKDASRYSTLPIDTSTIRLWVTMKVYELAGKG